MRFLTPLLCWQAVALGAFAPMAIALPAHAASDTESPTEIYFHQRGYVVGGSGAATRLSNAAVAAFEARRPDVRVHIVGVPWAREGDLKLRTALLARRRIDLFRVAHDQLGGFIPSRGRLLAPADPFMNDADRADFGENALAAVTFNDRVMAWPLWSTALMLVARSDRLDAAGIAPPEDGRPWTWDEFTAVLEKVSTPPDAERRVHGLNAAARPPLFEWAPLLMAHCGPLFEPDATAHEDGALPLAPGLADALGRVCALRERGLLAPSFGVDDVNAAQASFLDGRVAFLLTSPGFLRTLRAREVPFRILPPPTGRWGRPITTGAFGCFAVVDSGEARRIEAAHALARWLTSAEIAEAVPGWYLAPPVRHAVATYYDAPEIEPLADVIATAHYMQPPVGSGFMQTTFVPHLQGAVLGQQTPEAAVAAIQAAARRRVWK